MADQPEQTRPENEAVPEGALAQPVMLVAPSEYPSGPYSNFLQVTFTPHDFTLHFGSYSLPIITEPPKEPVRVAVRPMASVTVPLNLVRSFIGVLQGQITNWEQSFGEAFPDQPMSQPPPGVEQPS